MRKLEVISVRYFETRRGVGKTNAVSKKIITLQILNLKKLWKLKKI